MISNQDRYYSVSHSRLLRPLLRSPLFALGIHWVLQGVLEMDRTERLFKLSLDLLWMVVFSLALFFGTGLRFLWSLLLAFGAAHTLNLLLNGQIWVVLKHFGLAQHTREEFEEVANALARRAKEEPSIAFAAVFGSVVREEWSPTSDLDIRLIRHPGPWNGIRACVFVLHERTRAHLARFPLDIFVLDDERGLQKMRSDEPPQVFWDERGQ